MKKEPHSHWLDRAPALHGENVQAPSLHGEGAADLSEEPPPMAGYDPDPGEPLVISAEAAAEIAATEAPEPRAKILWHSNAPWVGTGYGQQSALFGPLLAERLGYRLAYSGFYGLKGAAQPWLAPSSQEYRVYPGGKDAYGNDVLGAHSRHWFGGEGGIVVTLTDPWVLNPSLCSRMPLAAWVPLDHEPLIPRTHEWLVKSQAYPIAMSRFGERMLREAGHDPVYVPHGFDPDIFIPLRDRTMARRALNLPQDAFLVGMVAANKGFPSRKGFAQALPAFAEFARTRPDAKLYLHTMMEEPEGENIPAICNSLKIRPFTTDQYALALGAPAALVGMLMNAFDVLLNPAWGEGFGVPILEAQASGTPVIATNFSAMPDVAPAEMGNWLVQGQRTWTPFDSWQVVPNIEAITHALELAYDEPEDERLRRRANVAAWAHSEFTAEHVTQEYWLPALTEIEERMSWSEKHMIRAPA